MSDKRKGIGASPGISIGKVFLYVEKPPIEPLIEDPDPVREKEKLLDARRKSKEQLTVIRDNAFKKYGKERSDIFTSHITMLEDIEVYKAITGLIDDSGMDAIRALKSGIKMYADMLSKLKGDYFKERAADIKDVGKRWLYNLLGVALVDLSDIPANTVLVSKDLSPSDAAQIDIKNVIGFVTEMGGKTSHSILIARSAELPAVIGVKDICADVKTGDEIIIDGTKGEVLISPSNDEKMSFEEKRKLFIMQKVELSTIRDKDAISKDGTKVDLLSNIGTPDEVDSAINNGAKGIGLFRTEFLFMSNDRFPTEEEQFEAYKYVAQKMADRPVTIRTMDIGGDKSLPYMEISGEINPFLGWRAIRICLDKPEILKTQYRAILRASHYGCIKIMLPMIMDINEIHRARSILEQCKEELHDEKIGFDHEIKLGIMVETPAVSFMADKFAEECDFFSIGTNDLTQYILAVDRGNERISKLYDTYNPAVLRAIKYAIDGAHKSGIPISMCGEFSGDPKATALLFGMGLDEFSMSSMSIPIIKSKILSLDKNECIGLADRVLESRTSKEVHEILNKKQ